MDDRDRTNRLTAPRRRSRAHTSPGNALAAGLRLNGHRAARRQIPVSRSELIDNPPKCERPGRNDEWTASAADADRSEAPDGRHVDL
jgi:hypothetical protein